MVTADNKVWDNPHFLPLMEITLQYFSKQRLPYYYYSYLTLNFEEIPACWWRNKHSDIDNDLWWCRTML